MRGLKGHKVLAGDRTKTDQMDIPCHITSHEKTTKLRRDGRGDSFCLETSWALVGGW